MRGRLNLLMMPIRKSYKLKRRHSSCSLLQKPTSGALFAQPSESRHRIWLSIMSLYVALVFLLTTLCIFGNSHGSALAVLRSCGRRMEVACVLRYECGKDEFIWSVMNHLNGRYSNLIGNVCSVSGRSLQILNIFFRLLFTCCAIPQNTMLVDSKIVPSLKMHALDSWLTTRSTNNQSFQLPLQLRITAYSLWGY